jgi:hypothetical protein
MKTEITDVLPGLSSGVLKPCRSSEMITGLAASSAKL